MKKYVLLSDFGSAYICDESRNRITPTFNFILPDGLILGQSRYFIARDRSKMAVFYLDLSDNLTRISDWFDKIYPDGLVKGESDYYIVEDNEKMAVFHKSGKMVSSQFYDYVYSDGLVKGESDYFFAQKDDKFAIFDVNGKMITKDWLFYLDYKYGLIKGQSPYFLAVLDYRKGFSICNNRGEIISPFFDIVLPYGLVEGKSDYYLACNKDTYAIYHKDGQKVSKDFPMGYIGEVEKITFNDRLGIAEIFNKSGDVIYSVEFNPVYPYKKEEFLDYTKLLNI
jgi:hypothetical protein